MSFVQKSCYCCGPYSEGFEYAIKMRDRKENSEPFNPYEPNTIEWFAFLDGYRDGLFTGISHELF